MDFLEAADGEGAGEGAVFGDFVCLIGVPGFNCGVSAAWGVNAEGNGGFFTAGDEAVGVDGLFYFEVGF